MEFPDSTLVARALAGERGAFAEIYARHHPALARRLRRILVRSEDVEDVLQSTFVAAYRALGRFRADGSLAAWLHGIAVRCAANHLRAQRRRWWLRTDSPGIDLARGPERSTEDRAAELELLGRIVAAMQTLPVDQRIAFALCDLEEMSAREAGELLGCSEKTVWARVDRARQRLARTLRLHGVELQRDLKVRT